MGQLCQSAQAIFAANFLRQESQLTQGVKIQKVCQLVNGIFKKYNIYCTMSTKMIMILVFG